MSPPNLDLIRQRFGYACGYCGVSEDSAGGLLTVDHYRPLATGGNDELENLIYSCIRCNQYKHRFSPSAEEDAQGFRVLHPLQDLLSLHFRLNSQTGRLEPLTVIGEFHIQLLHLNRPQLVRNRLTQQIYAAQAERIRLLEREVVELQQTVVAQENYIALLKELLT